jgi:drug/metabolite transporter (DMT)-like permease
LGPPSYRTVPRRLSSFPPEAGLAAVVLFWGLNFAVIKVPLAVMPPLVVNVLRFALSAAVLGAIHVAECRRRGVSVFETFRAGAWAVVGLGLLGQAVYQVGFILGIDRTTAGAAAILIAASPLVTAAAGHALGVDRLRAIGWAGFLVSLSGVALVVLAKPSDAEAHAGVGDPIGIALLLGSAVAWGLATVWSRALLDRGATPVGLSFWGVLTALPVLTAPAVPELLSMSWGRAGVPEWAAIVYSGALSTGVAYWLWYDAVQRVGPARAAAFSNLTPFVGVAAGVAFLGEPFVPLQVAGGALVVAGLVVMRRGDRTPTPAASEPVVDVR